MIPPPPTTRLASHPATMPTIAMTMSCCAFIFMEVLHFALAAACVLASRMPVPRRPEPSLADSSGYVEGLAQSRGDRDRRSRQGEATSDVQRPTERCKHALVHHLGQRRVREDRMHQVFLRRFELHGDHEALDQLRYLGADQVGS